MAVSRHHVLKRVSTRFGIRSPKHLLLLVTACLLHLETSAIFTYGSAQERITGGPPGITSIPVNVPLPNTTMNPAWNSLQYPFNVSFLSSEHTKGASNAPRSKKKKCNPWDALEAYHVSVENACRKLLLNLNIPENRIPQNEMVLLNEKFSMGNISLSVGNVSTIISEEYMCKCLAGKQMTVSDAICTLSVNINESPQKRIGAEYQHFIFEDHIINSLRLSTRPTYIKALSLRNNNIYNLSTNLWEHFVHLEVLDLSQNMLHTLNLTQTHFPFLNKLKLSKNKLQWFESAPCNLTSLYIDYNNITDLSFIANFKNLGILHASHNSVTSIPSSISNLTGLRCIFLDNNKIKNIAPLQGVSPKNMYKISISHNEIEHVNVDFTQHKLQILEMNNNNISYFNFTGVKRLVHVDLCNNRLSEIKPPHPLQDSSISSFILCNNSLTNAHVIMRMEHLKTLDLSNNNLGNMEDVILKTMYLKYLVLSNVSLRSLDFVKNLKDLEELEVDDNNITQFPKQLLGRNIKTLNLSNNPLEPIYCPSSGHWKGIIRSCNMSFNERNDNIILDLRMKSKEVNKKMECLLSKSSGKELLNQCSSYSGARIVVSKKYLFAIVIFILTYTNHDHMDIF